MKTAIVIPARYGSRRFPAKLLQKLGKKSILHHVHDRCKDAMGIDKVIIATDHQLIYDHCQMEIEADVQWTSDQHQSGTDRCAEIAKNLDVDFIINVQGDEPFINPRHLEFLSNAMAADPNKKIVTIRSSIETQDDFVNPNVVKVVCDKYEKALYFSRSPIPSNELTLANCESFRHIGVYGFSREILVELSGLAVSHLEEVERLEQLRWLENGYSIHALHLECQSLSIDTPEDLQLAKKIYFKNS